MRDMRWKCDEKGCYRQLMPRLGGFDDCFPGRIGMSDVDGIVEIGGRFLLLEWKAPGGAVQVGQRIMFERMTANADPMKFTVIVVCGDPQTLDVESVQVFARGKAGTPESSDLSSLKSRVSAWAERASAAKTRPSKRGAA